MARVKTNTTINGQNYYRIRRTVGHKMQNGEKVPIIKSFYGSSKGDAEKKYRAWLENKDNEISISDTVVKELLDDFAENILPSMDRPKYSTKANYIEEYKRFKASDPPILKLPLSKITPAIIYKAYLEHNTTASGVKALHLFFCHFFKWAVNNSYITSNPMSSLDIPNKPTKKKSEDGELVIWSDEELELIDQALANNRYRLAAFLGHYAGLRIGEVLGLKYSDIDNGTLHIRRQLYRGQISYPKYNSKRDIPIHPVLAKEIEKHTERYKAEKENLNLETDFVFTTRTGNKCTPTAISKSLFASYGKLGIEKRSFHTYRKTFCTKLCKANVPLLQASKLMGHKSVNVTARFYAQVDDQSKLEAILKL